MVRISESAEGHEPVTDVKSLQNDPVLYRMPRSGALISGTALDRPNRFVVVASVDGAEVCCYLPNPGRLWELIYPGAELILTRSFASMDYTVLGVKRSTGEGVPLHTHRANDLAAALVRRGLMAGHESARLLRREVVQGDCRFDLLLNEKDRELYTEVKCCTLFSGGGAYFPDAPSERACRHVRHLADLAAGGVGAAVMIVINSDRPRWFLPDWHTDPDFARAMVEARNLVDFVPLTLAWDGDLNVRGPVRRVPVPWGVLESENVDRGVCLALLERHGEFWCALERSCELSRTLSRWSRPRKHPGDAAEALRAEGRLLTAVPFRCSEDIFDGLARDLTKILMAPPVAAGERLMGRFDRDPRRWQPFVDVLLTHRFRRLDRRIEKELSACSQ